MIFFSFGAMHQSVAALQSPPTLTLLIFRRPKKKKERPIAGYAVAG